MLEAESQAKEFCGEPGREETDRACLGTEFTGVADEGISEQGNRLLLVSATFREIGPGLFLPNK